MKRAIEINIDEIVLLGIDKMDASSVSGAVEACLVRLIEEKGFPRPLASSLEVKQIDGGSFRVTRSVRPENIGNAIAGSVYQGITKQIGSSKK